MMKQTITWIGQPKDIQTKFGPKQKSSYKAAESGERYIDYWLSNQTKDWKVGAVVEIQEIQERDYNGKKYYTAVLPKMDRPAPIDTKLLSEIATKIGKLEYKFDQLISELSKILPKPQAKVTGTDIDYPPFENEPNFDR